MAYARSQDVSDDHEDESVFKDAFRRGRRAERARQALERQTPAIIERFVEEVEREMRKNQYDYPHDYEKAMAAVKARREGGEK